MYSDVRINLTEIVTQNKDAITSRLSVEVSSLELISKQLSDKITDAEKADSTTVRRLFQEYASLSDDPNLFWADAEGKALYTGGQEINISGRRYFQRALEGHQNVSERTVSRMNGDDIFVISVPLYYNNKIIGTIQKQYSPQSMYDICAVPLFTDQGFMYIINSQGYILVTSQQDTYSRESDNFFRMIYLTNPDASKKLEADLAENQSGFMEIETEGGRYFSVYTPIEEVYDWYLISSVATSAVSPNFNIVINLLYFILIAIVLFFAFIMMYYLYAKNKQQHQLERLAFVDSVTGGSSYTKLVFDMEQTLADHPDDKFYILTFDIDNFKYINSFYGFDVGDKILKRIYELYSEKLHPGELIARNTSDHFAAFLKDASEKRLAELFEPEVSIYGITVYLSAGIYPITNRVESVNLMVDKSGMAARKIKGMRYKRVEVYSDEFDKTMTKNEQMKRSIERALEEGEIIPYFQPKVDINTGEVVGAEALARWLTKDGKLIPPNDFIPLCEQTGLIVSVDMAIFEQTLQFIRKNMDAGVSCTPISVNFSRMHLLSKEFLDKLLIKLQEYHVPPELIELELTETIIYDNHEWINEFIRTLHSKGVQISMDDFGSGYSSLHMLKEVNLDVLKIDRGFLLDTVNSERQRVIFSAIVQMANNLHMKVVVEGVETDGNVALMKEYGCSIAQGYYYSRPIPMEAFEAIYRAGYLPGPNV